MMPFSLGDDACHDAQFPPTVIFFFLWRHEKVTFDLPPGMVSPDPVSYTIEWLGEDHPRIEQMPTDDP